MPPPVLQLRGVAKSFGSVQALKPIDLDLPQSQVLGLVGENGAGKSTLIKLLAGLYPPDAGQLLIAGRPVTFDSPRDALRAGIATIHQELDYCGGLTVAENMLLGQAWPRKSWGAVDWSELYRAAGAELATFGLSVSPHALFESLSTVQKQEVTIATALARDASLLILDEPTASLTEPEVDRLFDHLEGLRKRAITIIYVSHRLDEILRITDRVAVLRDGAMVANYATSEIELAQLLHDMVGRPIDQVYPHTRRSDFGPTRLETCELTCEGMFQDVSLSVHAGEIVGLAGLIGAGRSEIARAIYGLHVTSSGTMTLDGQPWRPRGPHDALVAGLAYLPEERKRQGLVLEHSVGHSISIGFSDLLTRYGLLRQSEVNHRVAHAFKQYDVRALSVEQPIGTLSGGNQQKSLLARWLERGPGVLLLDEPTRGVDIGAKAQIHAIIDQLAATGKAILLISSDLHELLGMCDRVLVLDRGKPSAELGGSELTEQNVVLASSGMYTQP